MTDRELMQQALEVLDGVEALLTSMDVTHLLVYGEVDKAIDALRERLAQPQMQPCAGRNCGSTNPNLHSAECFEDYEKTTGMAQPEQEPVAWGVIASNTGKMCQVELDFAEVEEISPKWVVPLYTTPPQREWQTLTENEIKHLWYEACQTNLELTSQLIVHLARNIEAKLKEKNT